MPEEASKAAAAAAAPAQAADTGGTASGASSHQVLHDQTAREPLILKLLLAPGVSRAATRAAAATTC